MSNRLPPEAPGFMPRRVGMNSAPSSNGFRVLKKETEKLALEVIWAEADRKKRELTNTKGDQPVNSSKVES